MNHVGRRQILRSTLCFINPALIFSGFRFPVASLAYETTAGGSTPIYNVPEAYAVYSAALRRDQRNHKEDHLTIASETCNFESPCLQPESKWPRPFIPIVRTYKEQIKTKWRLGFEFDLDKPYDLVPQAILDQRDDEEFQSTLPDGYIVLSPVSFNPQKSLAIVLISRVHRRSGQGSLLVLEKNHGKWVQFNAAGFGCGWASD